MPGVNRCILDGEMLGFHAATETFGQYTLMKIMQETYVYLKKLVYHFIKVLYLDDIFSFS